MQESSAFHGWPAAQSLTSQVDACRISLRPRATSTGLPEPAYASLTWGCLWSRTVCGRWFVRAPDCRVSAGPRARAKSHC